MVIHRRPFVLSFWGHILREAVDPGAEPSQQEPQSQEGDILSALMSEKQSSFQSPRVR